MMNQDLFVKGFLEVVKMVNSPLFIFILVIILSIGFAAYKFYKIWSGPYVITREIYPVPDKLTYSNRICPKKLMKAAIEKYITELVEKNRAFGHVEYKGSPTIDFRNLSHRIIKIEEKENGAYDATIKTMKTISGKALKFAIKHDSAITLVINAFGFGEENDKGHTVMQYYRIESIDIHQGELNYYG